MVNKNNKIAVIGLGYVGLPLAVEFGKKYNTTGFDINEKRIEEINSGVDNTLEIDKYTLKTVLKNGLFSVTNSIKNISKCNIYIVTVPTPTDKNNRPDLTPLLKASIMIGKILKKGDVVVYESTVYPGLTEEVCVPQLEESSNLIFNKDFFVGYSPERINPGDKIHTVSNIKKITSGSNKKTAVLVNNLYLSIINAGTYMATSIKVAEAAKVIENAQRDINIAFVNELSKIFNLIGIDTSEVLDAAATKWNFLKFQPGLVGGHCIGVDPYYLAQKAQELGYHPEIILAGRRLNDGMGQYVANQTIRLMLKENTIIRNSNILLLGFTFKENCPDFRNTKVIDIYNELITYDTNVDIFDPWVKADAIKKQFNINTRNKLYNNKKYDAIVISVAHDKFKEIVYKNYLKPNGVIYDVKGLLNKNEVNGRL